MSLDIKPEAINKLVAEMILKSTVGVEVEKSIARVIGDLKKTYDNPMDAVVKNHVATVIREILVKDYADIFREKLKEQLSRRLSDEFIANVCEHAARKFD